MLKGDIVVLDVETTGLSAVKDKIIEVCAVKMRDGVIIKTFGGLVDPQIPVSPEISAITGIRDNQLERAHAFNEIADKLYDFIGGATIAGHNVQFAMDFLAAADSRYVDTPIIDTSILAKELADGGKIYGVSRFTLSALADRFGIENPNAHTACNDALVTVKLLIALANLTEVKNLEN
jgi:DNA polymerase III epsilon subunit family exonuclease